MPCTELVQADVYVRIKKVLEIKCRLARRLNTCENNNFHFF